MDKCRENDYYIIYIMLNSEYLRREMLIEGDLWKDEKWKFGVGLMAILDDGFRRMRN